MKEFSRELVKELLEVFGESEIGRKILAILEQIRSDQREASEIFLEILAAYFLQRREVNKERLNSVFKELEKLCKPKPLLKRRVKIKKYKYVCYKCLKRTNRKSEVIHFKVGGEIKTFCGNCIREVIRERGVYY